MVETEDDTVAVERLFEQTRRFIDSWLTNARYQQARQAHPEHQVGGGPCQVHLLEVRHTDVLSLFRTANPAFNKLAALLVYLVEHVQELLHELEISFCPRLLVFGEEPQLGNPGSSEGEMQLLLARELPFLRDLARLLDRLGLLVENLLLQLGSLCAEHTRKATILQGDHVRTAFLTVADSLAMLIRIESICSRNPNLSSAFAMFARMLQSVGEGKDFDAAEANTADRLQGDLVSLQEQVMGKGAFRSFVEVPLARGTEVQVACGSAAFAAAAAGIIRQELAAVTSEMAAGAEKPGDRDSLLGVLALGALVFRCSEEQGAFDKKLLRQLLDLHQQVPLIPIYSELMLQPASFLSQYLPATLDSYIPAAYARQAAALRAQQLDRVMASFSSQLQRSALAVAAWVNSIGTLVATATVAESLLTQMAAAIVHGLALAHQVRHRLLDVLGQLQLSGAAIDRSVLRTLVHAACQVKAVEEAFRRHATAIAEALPHLVTHVKSGTQGLLLAMGASVRAKTRQAASSQSLLSIKAKRERAIAALQEAGVAIGAAVEVAKGPVSSMQLTAMAVCLEAVATTSTVPGAELQRLQDRVSTLRFLTSLQLSITKACSCGFLYFNRDLLDAGLKDLMSRPEEARKLPLILAAFGDAHQLLEHTSLDPALAYEQYDAELAEAVRRRILLPACDAIETHLRLEHHASLAPQSQADIEQPQDVTPLVHLEPIRLLTQIIDLRAFVEAELSGRFYNHTAVALHDWQTYAQLAALAGERLGLQLEPPDLPGLVVDPGLDLLEIMRQLPAFVAGYAYSLVDQTFIQRAAADIGTKHLMTLGLTHVVNALRKHGTRLADAVVNSACHLLARHFAVLSQWLFQDQVKSRLAKELRSMEEAAAHSSGSTIYPFSWAETLTADLRRLGSTPDGATYLDHLRRLVTEMGNAMALVRLMQQGKARQQASAGQFLKQAKGKPLPRFADALQQGAGEELMRSARLLDSAVERLSASSQRDPDYNSLLVGIFSEQHSPKNSHMASLYAAVPALTLNAVEAALLAKELLPHRRRGTASSAFTDDGFAMGLAFVLKVLDQDEQFASMKWLFSVEGHFASQQEELLGATQAAAGGAFSRLLGKLAGNEHADSQAQNTELARARLQSYAAEFKLLEMVYSCAQMLFYRS